MVFASNFWFFQGLFGFLIQMVLFFEGFFGFLIKLFGFCKVFFSVVDMLIYVYAAPLPVTKLEENAKNRTCLISFFAKNKEC